MNENWAYIYIDSLFASVENYKEFSRKKNKV